MGKRARSHRAARRGGRHGARADGATLRIHFGNDRHASARAVRPGGDGRLHHAYLQDLLDRKILFGSGAAKDETGKRHAGGVVILRAKSLDEAIAIAGQEPYVREKQRAMRVIPWQRTWFGD